jgi:hypothetical protein
MLWNEQDAFKDALRDVPDMIPVRGLWFLASTAMNIHKPDLMQIGKREQRKRGLDAVPPKTELEVAAGLWVIIRDGLRAAQSDGTEATPCDKPKATDRVNPGLPADFTQGCLGGLEIANLDLRPTPGGIGREAGVQALCRRRLERSAKLVLEVTLAGLAPEERPEPGTKAGQGRHQAVPFAARRIREIAADC